MGTTVSKKFVNAQCEFSFYEFKRILDNIKTLWDSIEDAAKIGINFDGRQFRDGMNDMLLTLSTILNDTSNLLPYFCWTKNFGRLDDELTIEQLWDELTEDK